MCMCVCGYSMGRVAVVLGNNKDRVVSSSFNIERKCYYLGPTLAPMKH